MKFAWDILKKLFIKIFGKIGYLFVNNIDMKKKVVRLTEEDLVRIIKKVVSEQITSNDDVGDQLDDLSKMSTVEEKILSYLPILNKTENELKDIEQEEMVNQVINTNETNRSLLKNIDDFWKYSVKGTGWEERYERPFDIVKSMIQSQKIDGNYIHKDFKWYRDIIRLSKREFEDFVRDVKNLEDLLSKYGITKDMITDKKDNIINALRQFGSKVPTGLRYRIRPLQRMIDQNFIDSTGPRPTTDTVVQRPPTDTNVRRRN